MGNLDLMPRLERTPGGGHDNPLPVFLPGESPWTEEPGGGYSPWGGKESDMTEQVSTSTVKLHLVVTFPRHSSS